jgi:hypothetical protein
VGARPVFELDAEDSLAEAEKQLIADVYWKYGRFAAWKLRDMTRQETPWAVARINRTISQELMITFFAQREDKGMMSQTLDTVPVSPERVKRQATPLPVFLGAPAWLNEGVRE